MSDVARADGWLKQHVDGLRGTPRITQYTGGASNWTYRFEYENRDLVLRRPPEGTKAKSAHDMGREYRLQKALRPVFPFVPEVIAYCEDTSVIGADFYVMEHLTGIIPRKELGVAMPPETVRKLCTNVLDVLIALHSVDPRNFEHLGKGSGYVRRQIEGWSDRYRRARTWNVPKGERIMQWLAANLPATERICIVHGDFRFDNVVLDRSDPTRVIGVLDWEMATLGDPLMDLGNTLAYWIEAGDDFIARKTRRQPTHVPGMLTRAEVVEYYTQRMGITIENWTFYEVYGLFRLSVIAQQIYYRYYHREVRNPAFKNFWVLVNYLHWRCRRLLR